MKDAALAAILLGDMLLHLRDGDQHVRERNKGKGAYHVDARNQNFVELADNAEHFSLLARLAAGDYLDLKVGTCMSNVGPA